MKKTSLFIIIYLLLTSCSGMSDAAKVLRNEKIKTTDEFLVKKRKPLELPPDYNELPEPGKKSSSNIRNEEDIKSILKAPQQNTQKNSNSSSVEESILKRIGK